MIQKVKGVCDLYYGSIPRNDLFNDPTNVAGIPEATKSIEPDHTVFDPGDCSDLIYVLQNGEADIYVQDNRKHKTLSHSVEHDRMYGLIEAVAGGQMWYSMKTRTNCTFSVVPRDSLLAALSRDPALCFKLTRILSRMNRQILSVAAA